MPADPYTLGIGVEVDRRVTRDALGRFTRDVEEGAQEAGNALGNALNASNRARGPAAPDLSWVTAAADKLYSLKAPAQEAFSAISSFVDAFRGGMDFMKPAEELENATQRMAATMGGGRAQAAALRTEIYSLGETSQFSVGEVTQLEQGLTAAGMTIGTFSADTQTAAVYLNQVFGVAGEEIARTSASVASFGGDIGSLLGEATSFTKSFGIGGMFEVLPQLIDDARHATLRFGKNVVGSGAQIISSTMNMAGTFAKAFGTTIADGLNRAQAALNKVRESAQQDADVFLGLGGELSGLTLAIMGTGVNLRDSMDIVREAGDGDLGALENITDILDRMPEGVMKDRFMRQLQQELPEDFLDLVTDVDKLHAAMANKKAAEDFEDSIGGKSVASFNALGSSVLDTTIELRKMFNNVLELTQAVVGQIAITAGLPEIFKEVKDKFAGWAKDIREFTQSGEFKETLEEWKPTIVSVGKILLTIGTVITTVGGAIAGLGGVLGIPGVGGIFKTLGSVAGKVFGKAGPIGLAIGAFMGVKTAIMDMGATLGDPNATGMEKFEALVRGGLKGVGKFFDTILLGIPGMIVDKFFPDLEMQFDSGVSGFMKRVSGFFSGGAGGIVETISQTVGGWMKVLGSFMLDHLPDIKGFAASFGRNFGGALGGAIKFGVETLMSIWKTEWEIVKMLLTGSGVEGGDGIADGVMTGLEGLAAATQVVWEGIKTFALSAFDGLLGAFGSSAREMGLYWDIAAESIKAAGTLTWNWLKFGFGGFVDLTSMALSVFVEDVETKFAKIIGAGKLIGATLWSVLTGDFKTLGGAIYSALAGPFAAIKAVGLAMAAAIQTALYDMAVSVAISLMSMFAPLDGLVPGIGAINKSLDETRETVSATRTAHVAASNEQVRAAEVVANVHKDAVAAATTASGNRLLAIQAETDAEVKSIHERAQAERDFLAEKISRRAATTEADTAEHQTRLGHLEQQLAVLADAREQQQARDTEARRFRESSRSALETSLQTIGTESTGKTDESAREATSALRDFMADQIATISDQVSKGVITTEQATARLSEAAKRGLEESKSKLKTSPADVSASAGGTAAGPSGGMNQEAIDQLLKNARIEVSKTQREQKIRVDFGGDGPITTAFARGANIRNQAVNGGH